MTQKKASKPYHHGNLKQQLLAEAEQLLESEGLSGLTLRAAARAAGVSHAAPKNHFGDLAGLTNELAIAGHQRLVANLAEASTRAPNEKLRAIGTAYIQFATDHPGLFALMFRSEHLDSTRAELRKSILELRTFLREAVTTATDATAVASATAYWSLIHGFTTLLLEGRLQGTLQSVPGETGESFLEKMLSTLRLA